MILDALVAMTLHFTYPTRSEAHCTMLVDVPLDDLAAVEVHFWPRYAHQDSVIYTAPANGREGTPESLTVTVDSEGTLWVVTVDNAGNASCASNYVGVAYTTSVPPQWSASQRTEWFDVAGRKYHTEPNMPGVYLVRQGKNMRRVVKLR